MPTELGAEIIKQARVVLVESSKINELVQLKKGELEGELRIGVIPTIAPYLLPRVLGGIYAEISQTAAADLGIYHG